MTQIVEFKTIYPPNKEPFDKVLLAPSGAAFQKTRTWHRISHIKPKGHLAEIEHPEDARELSDTDQAMVLRWLMIKPKYDAWKRGSEVPEEGVPLAAWSGVNEGQAQALRALGVRTVEAVAEMNDQAIATLRWPDARKLPMLAKKYLEGADGAKKDAELAEMTERMKAMEELLEEAMKNEPSSEPKKRGRPPKDQAA